MSKTIRARVRNGVLEPLEQVELPEGQEVTVTIEQVSSTSEPEREEVFRRVAGGWKGLVDADALIANIYRDRFLDTRPEPRL